MGACLRQNDKDGQATSSVKKTTQDEIWSFRYKKGAKLFVQKVANVLLMVLLFVLESCLFCQIILK